MKSLLLCAILTVFIGNILYAQAPGNDGCNSATPISAGPDCINTPGNLYLANQSNPGGTSCGNRYDVWYRFTSGTNETFVTINVNLLTPSNTTLNTGNTFIEFFNTDNCAALSTNPLGGCQTVNSSRTYAVTPGTEYYFRIYTNATPNSNSTQWRFNVCVTSNNECATATTIIPGSTNTMGSVWNATASSGIPAGCATGNPNDDVWYRFTAVNSYATITLGTVSNGFNTSGARIQLFSGSCGSLTSLVCSGTRVLNATGLNIGAEYFIRIYSAGTPDVGSNGSSPAFHISISPSATVTVGSGRMKEVYQQTILSAPGVLVDPWEVIYGPDEHLWITESKGSRVYRVNPLTGVRDTILNLAQGSTFFSFPQDTFNLQFDILTIGNAPQGGLAGMALHPQFMASVSPMNFVYLAYVHKYLNTAGGNGGVFYRNMLARFYYNTATGKLESPERICDTLPGSSDHNSQRMIIAPVNGVNFLFYASGDMGAGQFTNHWRPQHAQVAGAYAGKILRYNLEPEISEPNNYTKWIPNDNPNPNSAVWARGIRNNQGFAYDTAKGILYGSSHGPYSDDEINIIERNMNYGHPLVIGMATDENYATSSAGAPNTTSTCPIITSEITNRNNIGTSYRDPLFSAYASSQSAVHNIWINNPNNGGWPSEGWSGMDFYSHTLIPAWKNSLVLSSLKKGRILRIKTGPTGNTILQTEGGDTVSYFGSTNRFRDLAFAPNGKDMYVVMDRSATTSGPSAANPVIPACGGCIQKYTFLGYHDVAGKSDIPKSIEISTGIDNNCAVGTMVTISGANNNLWVPVTGPDGNIMAEINAHGQNLGTITSSFYRNTGTVRQHGGVRYLDRNITITPAVQPSSPVSVRFYLTSEEFEALRLSPGSGINSISDLRVLKNSDACMNSINSSTSLINPAFAELHDTTDYVVQASINSFSSFYFGSQLITLPLDLISFTGSLVDNVTLLKWKTEQENNTSHFMIERSINGSNYNSIGSVSANGVGGDYGFQDAQVANLGVNQVYYRLKMIDNDGRFTYSGIVRISLNYITGVMVAPNPVLGEVNMMVNAVSNGRAIWTLSDNAGRLIMSNTATLKTGLNNITINMNRLAAGVYHLQLKAEGIDRHFKLQKL